METKTVLPVACALLVALGQLPGASGMVKANDAITRTFDAIVLAQVEFLLPGLGIQSPTAPCPAVLLGIVQAAVSDVFYYQSDREATNLKTGSTLLPTGQPPIIVLAGPCPIPGSGPGAPVSLTIPDLNVHGPYEAVAIDQTLCGQGNGGFPVDCLPDPTTALATISHCNKDDAFFTQMFPPDGKSVFMDFLGSRFIGCLDLPLDPTDGFKYSVTYYDGAAGGPTGPTPYCVDWFFAAGGWGTEPPCYIQNEDTTPLGNGLDETGYLVTCMSIMALVIDPSKGVFVVLPFATHDYKLVLDLDGTPENWLDAKIIHWGAGLRGWHDLGGSNGFPCPAGAVQPLKKGDFPIVPTPLSPKK